MKTINIIIILVILLFSSLSVNALSNVTINNPQLNDEYIDNNSVLVNWTITGATGKPYFDIELYNGISWNFLTSTSGDIEVLIGGTYSCTNYIDTGYVNLNGDSYRFIGTTLGISGYLLNQTTGGIIGSAKYTNVDNGQGRTFEFIDLTGNGIPEILTGRTSASILACDFRVYQYNVSSDSWFENTTLNDGISGGNDCAFAVTENMLGNNEVNLILGYNSVSSNLPLGINAYSFNRTSQTWALDTTLKNGLTDKWAQYVSIIAGDGTITILKELLTDDYILSINWWYAGSKAYIWDEEGLTWVRKDTAMAGLSQIDLAYYEGDIDTYDFTARTSGTTCIEYDLNSLSETRIDLSQIFPDDINAQLRLTSYDDLGEGGNDTSDIFIINNTETCFVNWTCDGYASCDINDEQICNNVFDNTICGYPYTGDYSEFTNLVCDFCTPIWECNSLGDCQENNLQVCDGVQDLNTCSELYIGDYSEFLLSYCYYTVCDTDSTLGICSVFSEAGAGIGEFTGQSSKPLGKFILFLSLIGGIIGLVYSIIYVIKKAINKGA